MADERHVTFGGSFKFDDSGLIKANKQIDELLKRGKSVTHMFDDVKGLKGFGSSISDAEKSLNGFDNKFDKFREKANKGIKTKIDFDDDQATRKLDHFKTMSEKIPENKHTKMSVDDNASSKFKDAYEASKKVPKIHETTLKAKNETKPASSSGPRPPMWSHSSLRTWEPQWGPLLPQCYGVRQVVLTAWMGPGQAHYSHLVLDSFPGPVTHTALQHSYLSRLITLININDSVN